MFTQVSQCEDVGSMVAVQEVMEEPENLSDISSVLGKSRHQILAAQFECYLKIIHDPPRTEEGDQTLPVGLFVQERPARSSWNVLHVSLMLLTHFVFPVLIKSLCLQIESLLMQVYILIWLQDIFFKANPF